jgi:hypothetical protein
MNRNKSLGRQEQAMRLYPYIGRRIKDGLDDNSLTTLYHLLNRYNAVRNIAHPAAQPLTPGQFLDDYLEERAFLARM